MLGAKCRIDLKKEKKSFTGETINKTEIK